MTPEELEAAWDLWFDLAQATNDHDPPYEHGVFAGTSPIPGQKLLLNRSAIRRAMIPPPR
jgi:hypothetical protein